MKGKNILNIDDLTEAEKADLLAGYDDCGKFSDEELLEEEK